MDLDRAVLQLQLGTRRMTTGVVRRLPVTVADRLRGPVTAPPQARRHRARDALAGVLRRGGIPAGVTTFTLRDNQDLAFVNAESLVLHQLYWFGEQGWEPQLLPWWRRFCRRASAVLELGANVGYFTVQGAKAAPHARYIAVEPYPASARVCRANTGGGNAPECTDIGTQVRCTGKVAGLGGTTFEITIEADGIASVVCINPGGNRAPGQDTAVTVEGTTEPLPTPRNGQFRFTVTTDDPEPLPPTPTCPNNQWTPEIVDVTFTTATLSLFENGVLSDQVMVPVS